MAAPQVPITNNILGGIAASKVQDQTQYFRSLLPATFRTRLDSIIASQPTLDFLEKELLVERLNAIQEHLWVCGRPMPARPLNIQLLLGRNITITENIELHLVWSKNRIFIKPIPLYLLVPEFWKVHLIPSEGKSSHAQFKPILSQSGSSSEMALDAEVQRKGRLYSCALGFLSSYIGLIAYESDFKIAKCSNLLPSTIEWSDWQAFTSEFLTYHSYSSVNPRYWYGELRLTRLNKVYRFKKGYILRGYSKIDDNVSFDGILRDNFAGLAAVLVYVAIVLTAMQLGIATDELGHNNTFQRASYGFTILSIIVPLIVSVLITVGVIVLVISNWTATKIYEKTRFREMGVEPFWKIQRKGSVRSK